MRKPWFWIALGGLVVSLAAAPDRNVARTRIANGFDFPVGKPNADGYYKARGFRAGGHPGEDWNGIGGGNSDLGDPVYCIGDGMVIFSRDVRMGWGNVVIVRHVYVEKGELKTVDSFYAHLNKITVKDGQQIRRGDQLGTIGTNRGMYPAHLHFEIRKNLFIGINRSAFRRDLSNYFVPTDFITPLRTIKGGGRSALIAINTFGPNQGLNGPGTGSDLKTQTAKNIPKLSSDRSSTPPKVSTSRRSTFKVDRFGEVESF